VSAWKYQISDDPNCCTHRNYRSYLQHETKSQNVDSASEM